MTTPSIFPSACELTIPVRAAPPWAVPGALPGATTRAMMATPTACVMSLRLIECPPLMRRRARANSTSIKELHAHDLRVTGVGKEEHRFSRRRVECHLLRVEVARPSRHRVLDDRASLRIQPQ